MVLIYNSDLVETGFWVEVQFVFEVAPALSVLGQVLLSVV
jgi:hypothetical protein